ncbi:MAG TPA: hypothetical protein VFK12_02550, partial [Gammaproteobacteria bacterium]|nr:hypothetical protein [Gammaproteobacteria bacterium]
MKIHFRSPISFIVPIASVTLILGSLGIGSIAAGRTETVIAGMICLVILSSLYWFAISLMMKPAVIINDKQLLVCGVLGRKYKIDEIWEYHLVINRNWIGFRRSGAQDVIL